MARGVVADHDGRVALKGIKPAPKIAISGSAQGTCSKDTVAKAREVGREIVRQGAILVSGATTGIPNEAARGSKEEGGFSIGLSPAVSEKEHTRVYHLPTRFYDVLIYTGFDYAGRNFLMTRTADAVIIICGRIGTLNEFTIAFEDKKPVGVLLESGRIADEIEHILEVAQRVEGVVVYDREPRSLVRKILELIRKEKRQPVGKARGGKATF